MDLCSAPEDCQGCGWCLDEEQQRETIAAAKGKIKVTLKKRERKDCSSRITNE